MSGLGVRLMVSLTWRLSRRRMLGSLRLFAATEADSAWQLAYAAARAPEPERKAELFGQVLEEMRHADEFRRLCKDMSETVVAPLRYERKPLYPAAADVWRFYAYCQVGEAAAARRFKHIHDATRVPAVKEVLRRILRDEAQHVHGAEAMLGAVEGVSDAERRAELVRIKARRAWEAWLRAGRNIADVVAVGILSVVYAAVGPVGWLAARQRFRTKDAACTRSDSLTASTTRALPS